MRRSLGALLGALVLSALSVAPAIAAGPAAPRSGDAGTVHAHALLDGWRGGADVQPGAPAQPLLHPKVALGSRAPIAPAAESPSTRSPGVEASVPVGGKEVSGFAQAGEVTGGYWRTDLRLNDLTTINFFSVPINDNGVLLTGDPGYTAWRSSETTAFINAAHAAGDRVVLTIKDFGAQSIETLTSTEAYRQTAVNAIVAELGSRGGDGVNLDFEGGYPTDQPQDLVTFVAELEYGLRTRIPAASYLTIDTYASSAMYQGSTMFDLAGLRPYVDAVDVMDYDINSTSSSSAGPVAPLGNNPYSTINIVNGYEQYLPGWQIILGVPYYGYKWCVSGPYEGAPVVNCANGVSSADTYSGTVADIQCAAQYNLSLGGGYDPGYQEPYAWWWSPSSDPCGGNHNAWRELFYENAQSLGAKYDLVNQKGVRGIGIWALGYDSGYADLWNEIEAKLPVAHGMSGVPTVGRVPGPAAFFLWGGANPPAPNTAPPPVGHTGSPGEFVRRYPSSLIRAPSSSTTTAGSPARAGSGAGGSTTTSGPTAPLGPRRDGQARPLRAF